MISNKKLSFDKTRSVRVGSNTMNDRELVESRVAEKQKLANANRQMTKLFMLTSSLIFLTLFFVWLAQKLPELFMPSIYDAGTLVIIGSSICVTLAQVSIKKDQIDRAYNYAGLGFIAGFLFTIFQIIGWQEMIQENTLYRNILFPFALIHFIHILVGLGLLLSVFFRIKEYRVHSKSRHFAYNVFMFWHFLGAVWLVFFLLT